MINFSTPPRQFEDGHLVHWNEGEIRIYLGEVPSKRREFGFPSVKSRQLIFSTLVRIFTLQGAVDAFIFLHDIFTCTTCQHIKFCGTQTVKIYEHPE